MGFSGKPHQVDVIAGINPLRAPLKPVYTKPITSKDRKDDDDHHLHEAVNINVRDDEEEETNSDSICCTTPTGEESRIVSSFCPPPAPRKRKAASKCTGVREFFTPPDLESVFIIRHVQRA